MNFKNIIMEVWQLPQNILGFIVKKLYAATPYTTHNNVNVYSWNNLGGISLGKYIFVPFHKASPNTNGVQRYIRHEYGHCVQSRYLGWFYLIVIGLPSITWAGCFEWYRKKTGTSYYDFYTEKWADKLGGVNRDGN